VKGNVDSNEKVASGEHFQDSGTTFEVKFSMLEIYNEVVRDLLDPKGASKKGGLKVRQHPKRGFYGESNQRTNTWSQSYDS
jgi:hypothetical protein